MPRVAIVLRSDSSGEQVLSGALRILGRRSDIAVVSNVWFGHPPLRHNMLHQLDACLVIGFDSAAQRRQIEALDIPRVYTHVDVAPPDAYVVRDDDAAFGQRGFEHLRSLGLRHFGFCGSATGDFNHYRAAGFEAAVARGGGTCHTYFGKARRFRDGSAWDLGQQALQQWLVHLPKPVGIMASFDLLAMEVLSACHAVTLRVPEHVAVLGVDNRATLCEAVWPHLSSITRSDHQRGILAARMLLTLLDGGTPPARTGVVAPGPLVQRTSTTFLATDDPLVVQYVRLAQRHVQATIGVEQLLDLLSVSRRTLEKRVRRELGRTPAQELRRLRIERAKQLLVSTNDSMSTVATACGFRNQNRFAQAFKLATGGSPTQWRQRERFADPGFTPELASERLDM